MAVLFYVSGCGVYSSHPFTPERNYLNIANDQRQSIARAQLHSSTHVLLSGPAPEGRPPASGVHKQWPTVKYDWQFILISLCLCFYFFFISDWFPPALTQAILLNPLFFFCLKSLLHINLLWLTRPGMCVWVFYSRVSRRELQVRCEQ